MTPERIRERLLEALIVCGGELPRTPLKALAFGGEQVWSGEVSEALAMLEAAGKIAARRKRIGRHGVGAAYYRATVTTVRDSTRGYGELMTTLAASDRLTLLDFAHAQATCEVAEGRPGIWLRISTALQAAERGAAGDLDPGAPGDADLQGRA